MAPMTKAHIAEYSYHEVSDSSTAGVESQAKTYPPFNAHPHFMLSYCLFREIYKVSLYMF